MTDTRLEVGAVRRDGLREIGLSVCQVKRGPQAGLQSGEPHPQRISAAGQRIDRLFNRKLGGRRPCAPYAVGRLRPDTPHIVRTVSQRTADRHLRTGNEKVLIRAAGEFEPIRGGIERAGRGDLPTGVDEAAGGARHFGRERRPHAHDGRHPVGREPVRSRHVRGPPGCDTSEKRRAIPLLNIPRLFKIPADKRVRVPHGFRTSCLAAGRLRLAGSVRIPI